MVFFNEQLIHNDFQIMFFFNSLIIFHKFKFETNHPEGTRSVWKLLHAMFTHMQIQ